jgi:hypothetical protein
MENGRFDDWRERPQSADLANVIMKYSPGVTSKSAIQEISGVPKKSLQKYNRLSTGFTHKHSKKKWMSFNTDTKLIQHVSWHYIRMGPSDPSSDTNQLWCETCIDINFC